MSAPAPDSAKSRDLLRRYLLDTASPRDRARVDGWLAEDPTWREALDSERAALDLLGALSDQDPSRNLTDAVLRAVEADAEPEVRGFWSFGTSAAFATVLVIVAAAVILPGLNRAKEVNHAAAASNAMKQFGLIFKVYASENNGWWPPVSPYPEVWAPDYSVLYPDFMGAMELVVHPELPDAEALANQVRAAMQQDPPDWETIARISAKGFTYLPWGFDPNDSKPLATLAARDWSAEGWQEARVSTAVKITTPADEFYQVPRLREGMERFLITDLNNMTGAENTGPSVFITLIETNAVIAKKKNPGEAIALYADGRLERHLYERTGAPRSPAERSIRAFAPGE
jgi:type II secretory pathway pseudopilin PulG